MKVIHDGDPGLDADDRSVVSIGTFDGVHLGHQHVLRHLRAEAEARDVLSAVVTFDIHPALVLRPENAPKILMSLDQKIELPFLFTPNIGRPQVDALAGALTRGIEAL